jgi:hypothetical protein
MAVHLVNPLAKLPKDMGFFTQITMESAEDTDYLDAMRQTNIKGALVGKRSPHMSGSMVQIIGTTRDAAAYDI